MADIAVLYATVGVGCAVRPSSCKFARIPVACSDARWHVLTIGIRAAIMVGIVDT